MKVFNARIFLGGYIPVAGHACGVLNESSSSLITDWEKFIDPHYPTKPPKRKT